MSPFLALMAAIGMLTSAFALSYPVGYVIDRVILRPLGWFTKQRAKWDAAYRD